MTISAARMVMVRIVTPLCIPKQSPYWGTLRVQRKRNSTEKLVKNSGLNLTVETKFSDRGKKCKSCQNR